MNILLLIDKCPTGHVNTDLPDQWQSLVSSAWPFQCILLLPSAPPYHWAPLGVGRRSLHRHTHPRCDEGLLRVEPQNGGDVLAPHSYHSQQYYPVSGKDKNWNSYPILNKYKIIIYTVLSEQSLYNASTASSKHGSNTASISLTLRSGVFLSHSVCTMYCIRPNHPSFYYLVTILLHIFSFPWGFPRKVLKTFLQQKSVLSEFKAFGKYVIITNTFYRETSIYCSLKYHFPWSIIHFVQSLKKFHKDNVILHCFHRSSEVLFHYVHTI